MLILENLSSFACLKHINYRFIALKYVIININFTVVEKSRKTLLINK